MVRTGRRPGTDDTRRAIITAAREEFAAGGYRGASIRRVAAAAGVDPALVYHYFHAKDELFFTVLRSTVDVEELVAQVFAGPPETSGERLVALFLRLWDGGAGSTVSALLRTAVLGEPMARLVRDMVFPRVIAEMIGSAGVDPEEAPPRAVLIASQLSGLATTRYLLQLEPMASAPADVVAEAIGPTIQRYLTGQLPHRPSGWSDFG